MKGTSKRERLRAAMDAPRKAGRPKGVLDTKQRSEHSNSESPMIFRGPWPERVRLSLQPEDIYGSRRVGAEQSAVGLERE